MKRQKHKKNLNGLRSKKDYSSTKTPDKKIGRRYFFTKVRNITFATLIIGGVGWFAVEDVRATMQEHDLSRIGNGIPSIVQIHDPNCNLCVALQSEARDALSSIEEGKLQFLVANILSDEGKKLASTHGVGHVTLLLFDATGKKRSVLEGPNDSGYLKDVFQQHLTKFGTE